MPSDKETNGSPILVQDGAQAAISTALPSAARWREADARVVVIVVMLVGAYAASLAEAGGARDVPAMIAMLGCATIAGVVGFAFAGIAAIALALLMTSPVVLVQTIMLCSIANQVFAIVTLWRHVDWRRTLVFLSGGMLGLPIGIYALFHLDLRGFHIALGTILVLYGGYALLKRPFHWPSTGRLADVAVGILGGITGGIAAFPGGPVTIWCGTKGWDKRRQRGVFQPYILIMQITGLVVITLVRTHGELASLTPSGGAFQSLAMVPASAMGTWIGLRIFHRISDRGFASWVAALLLFSGALLLAQ